MRASRRNARDEIRKRSRATKDGAGHQGGKGEQGIGEPEEGVRLPASDYTEEPPASFPGVAEPVVEPAHRGASPPATPLPHRPDDAD